MGEDGSAGATRRTRGPSIHKTAKTRAAVVVAAREVFLEHGYSASRIADIAHRANVATGTVYRYFDTKEALFEEVLREAVTEPLASVRAAIDAEDGDIGSALRELLLPLAREFQDGYRGALLRIVLAESVRFPTLAESYRRVGLAPMLEQVRAMATEAGARGQTATDALVRFPQLMLGVLVLTAFRDVFGSGTEWDAEAMLDAHLGTLFVGVHNRSATGDAEIGRPPGPGSTGVHR